MTLLYNLQLHEPGQWGTSTSRMEEQQQLELDLTGMTAPFATSKPAWTV